METPTQPRTSRTGLFLIAGLAVLFVAWVVYALVTGSEIATIRQGEAETYTVRVADNALERMKGLSGTYASDLSPEIGMLFVFDEAAERTFWMKGMQYNLDILWIKDGKIMKIDENVPYPPHGTEPVSVSSAPLLIDMVLELPAGTADEIGYLPGHQLTINLDAE
ncbi:DUF192 domain-containing protein [Candidatus Uhrbacteria bacterium]|nr:DUF192 domain-containing protein [Candidatus Uhrbacteria bacterium]